MLRWRWNGFIMLGRGTKWTDWICIYVQKKYKVGLSRDMQREKRGSERFFRGKGTSRTVRVFGQL